MESKTASALGIGIVSVVTPLVFPQIPLPVGIGFYVVAAGFFLFAGRGWLRDRLPARWRKTKEAVGVRDKAPAGVDGSGIALQHYRDPDDGPVELTLSLVRRLAAQPINYKTLKVLRLIARSETPEFQLKDAIEAVEGADLQGVWSGLTRRTRKILNDPRALLIWWRGEDDDGLYHIGEVSRLTHASLRKHFGLPDPSG